MDELDKYVGCLAFRKNGLFGNILGYIVHDKNENCDDCEYWLEFGDGGRLGIRSMKQIEILGYSELSE